VEVEGATYGQRAVDLTSLEIQQSHETNHREKVENVTQQG
jgi:hypothetical protein